MPIPRTIATGRALLGQGSVAGPLDLVLGAIAAYSVARRLRSGYTGPLIRLRRDSDEAEKNFGANADGNLDTLAIATWLGAATAYIVTLFDQGLAGNNATQATAANQPLFVASMTNGRAGARLDGTNDSWATAAFSAELAQPNTMLIAGMRAAIGAGNYMTDGISDTKRHALFADAGNTAMYAGAQFNPVAATEDVYEIHWMIYNGAASKYSLNGGAEGTGNAGTHALTGFTFGARYNAAQPMQGDLLEVFLYNAALSVNNKVQLLLNVNGYYKVY